jgi:DNA-binding response OmpR family regulator
MPARIMVVNHDETTLEMLSEVFTEEDFEVKTAHMGPSTLDELRAFRPSLVLLDWRYSEEDQGMTLMQNMRLDRALADIPLLVTSAASRRLKEIEDSLRAKGIAVLYKPYGIDELLAIVNTQLDKRGNGGT